MAALNHTQERKANTSNGGVMLLLTVVVLGLLIWAIVEVIRTENGWTGLWVVVLSLVFTLQLVGFYTLQPNEAVVLLLFGEYRGTLRESGFYWANPCLTKKKVSLRLRSMEGQKLKVNDKQGNPIEIATVIV